MRRVWTIFSDNRAITPVLSTLLLMVVAVAAMSIATTAAYVITTNLRETMSERVIVEDIWFNNSTHNIISVYLRNIGKISIQVSAIYVNSTKHSFSPTPFVLKIGEHGWVNVSRSWDSGNLYHIDIVTVRGFHVADYYKAP